MTALKNRFCLFFITAGIVLSTAITACGGGAKDSSTATDGTTITASSPSASSIYISTVAPSNHQVTLKFSVTKSGVGIANATVAITLNDQALNAGVRFLGGTTTLSLTTDSTGNTSTFAVVAGNIPTSIIVKGSTNASTVISDYSTPITVSSGSPVQDRFSLAIEATKEITESWTNITVVGIAAYVADRLGNAVPDGTLINFTVSAGGTAIGSGGSGSCTTVASTCSVTLTLNRGTNTNPFVTVLASATGEESFSDTNGNNKYDVGENFVDLGNFFRDDNVNGIYDGIDQPFTTASAGSSACPSFPLSLLNIPNTCDGLWSGSNLIRAQTRLYMAESQLSITNFVYAPATGLISFKVSGVVNGGQAPPQTAITITFPLLPANNSCTAGAVSNSPVVADFANVTLPTSHSSFLTGCSGQKMFVTATTKSGIPTTKTYDVP
jgi:hypothetical protein